VNQEGRLTKKKSKAGGDQRGQSAVENRGLGMLHWASMGGFRKEQDKKSKGKTGRSNTGREEGSISSFRTQL